MQENDNIQTPVKTNIRDIVNKYGSHYTLLTVPQGRHFQPKPFTLSISEEVGPKDKLNNWEHQFATLEEALKAASNRMEINHRDILKAYESRDSKFSWKLHTFFAKIGLLSQSDKKALKEHSDFMLQLKRDIESLKNKQTAFEVKKLEGEYTMPMYIPEVGKTYYMLNLNDFTNVKLTPMTLDPDNVLIFDYRGTRSSDTFADQFDFKFSHYFVGPNDETASLDSDRLLRFNGSYWNLGIHNYYLFVDEKEALSFAKKCAENKVVRMQRELVAINESIAKL